MSGTTPPPATVNDNTTQGSAAAASGAAAAIVVIATWALGHYNITVPGDVAAAFMVLVSAGIHLAGVWFVTPKPGTPPTP